MIVITTIDGYLNALPAQDNHQIEQQSKPILVLLSYIVGPAEAKLHCSGLSVQVKIYLSANVSVYAEARGVWGYSPPEIFFKI